MPSQDYSTYNNYNMAPPKKRAKAADAASSTAAASGAAGGAQPTLAGATSAPLAAAAAAGVAPDPSAQPVAVGQLTGMFNQFGAEMMKQIEASLQTKLNGVTAGQRRNHQHALRGGLARAARGEHGRLVSCLCPSVSAAMMRG